MTLNPSNFLQQESMIGNLKCHFCSVINEIQCILTVEKKEVIFHYQNHTDELRRKAPRVYKQPDNA